MAISNAVERHHIVFVYDHKGRNTAQIFAGHCPGDGLKSFTSSTVTVRKLGRIFVHDEQGVVQVAPQASAQVPVNARLATQPG
jgi:hypothetical protein